MGAKQRELQREAECSIRAMAEAGAGPQPTPDLEQSLRRAGHGEHAIETIGKLCYAGNTEAAIHSLNTLRPRMGGKDVWVSVVVLASPAIPAALKWDELVAELSTGAASWLPAVAVGVLVASGAMLRTAPRLARLIVHGAMAMSVVCLGAGDGMLATGHAGAEGSLLEGAARRMIPVPTA